MLVMIMLAVSIIVPMKKAGAATTYNNTISASTQSSVSSNGKLKTIMQVIGIKDRTTRIEVELYVEKRILGIFWSRVDIDLPNNVWTDFVNASQYSNTFTTQLNSTGTYRVKGQFTVYGSGGAADVIPFEDTVTY